MRHRFRAVLPRALALATLAALAGGVADVDAKPAGRPPPVDELRIMAPVVKPVEVVSGHAAVAAQIEERSGAILACAERGRATFVRARVRLRWNARGQVRAVTVSGAGGAFNRCAGRALRGAMAAPPMRAGTGGAALVVRTGATAPPAPAPRPMPIPMPITKPGGKVDLDCENSRCVVRDAGPQPTMHERLTAP